MEGHSGGGIPWTSREIAKLRELAPNGAAFVADVLGRSEKSVKRKAEKLRITLRPAGVRTGIILGQPRGVSWIELQHTARVVRAIHEFRERVLAGELDPAVLAHDDDIGELCPGCARHPIEVTATGLCRGCHHSRLAERLREREAAEEYANEGKRDHWRARQDRSRARRRTTPEVIT